MKICTAALFLAAALLSVGCADSAAQSARQEQTAVIDSRQNEKISQEVKETMVTMQNDIGTLSPKEALAYMKKTENLLIVDAAAKRWYEQKTFTGAVNMPVEELSDAELTEAAKKLPAGHPVLVHCRRGMVAPQVYRRIKEVRPDIPEIAWLDGTPLFDEYNEWVIQNK